MSEAPLDRLVRALRLEADVFAEIADDERATGPALVLVLGAAGLAGLGSPHGLLGFGALALAWLVWVAAIHLGAGLLGLPQRLGPLFRAAGFATAPWALGLAGAVPGLGALSFAAGQLWALAAMSLATSRVLACETFPAACLSAAGLGLAWLASRIIL